MVNATLLLHEKEITFEYNKKKTTRVTRASPSLMIPGSFDKSVSRLTRPASPLRSSKLIDIALDEINYAGSVPIHICSDCAIGEIQRKSMFELI